MANPTYDDLAGHSESILTQIQKSTAILASGKNPDGTTNTAGGSAGNGGGAATIADGADVTEGAVADAAVVTNAVGTVSAKLRGLVALIAALSKAEDAIAASGDFGVMSLAVRRDTDASQAADGDYSELQVDSRGALRTVSVSRSGTGTQSSVANSVANFTALAANAARRGATIYNDDTAAAVKVKLGVTASVSSFCVAIGPGGYYEVPFGYTGIIDAIASVATGNLRVTELS